MKTYQDIMYILGIVLAVLSAYHVVYLIIGFFGKAVHYEKTRVKKKYAIVIPARNEEKVIGKLIESIKKQTYDQSLLTIFVIADNCTDKTTEISRSLGCHVYERNEPHLARKGYALSFLFKAIEKDFGIQSFDGYFFFDADNLLDYQFVEKMNEAFDVHPTVITSYRNTKNFDTNIISSAYGIHFYRSSMAFHRPRSILKFGTHIAGTGYLVASFLLKNGWNYTELTEDTEFTIDLATKNIKIGYCEAAVLYDEQPTNLKVSFRQRIRWTKGRMSIFFKSVHKLFGSLFKYKTWTAYDMLYYLAPWDILNMIRRIVSLSFAAYTVYAATNGALALREALWVELGIIGGNYLLNVMFAALVLIRERKQVKCSGFKRVLYVFTYPWFNLVSGIITLLAMIIPKVTWKPIAHNDNRDIDDLVQK